MPNTPHRQTLAQVHQADLVNVLVDRYLANSPNVHEQFVALPMNTANKLQVAKDVLSAVTTQRRNRGARQTSMPLLNGFLQPYVVDLERSLAIDNNLAPTVLFAAH